MGSQIWLTSLTPTNTTSSNAMKRETSSSAGVGYPALSKTNFLLADGTFTCVLDGHGKLYIFHAVVENNVSLPMLYCLLHGKDEETYARILRLVEALAAEDNTTVFGRPSRLCATLKRPSSRQGRLAPSQ